MGHSLPIIGREEKRIRVRSEREGEREGGGGGRMRAMSEPIESA